MDYQSQHTMVLVNEFEDGSQEWHCPICGRRFIMQWPPNYKRTIIDEGDPQAVHSGGTGGVSMGDTDAENMGELPYQTNEIPSPFLPADDQQNWQPEDALPDQPPVEDDPYLEPFKAWLDQQNL